MAHSAVCRCRQHPLSAMSTRYHALNLRSGSVPALCTTGRPAARAASEVALAHLNQFTRKLPTNQHVLIPCNWKDAHCRSDSMCVLLGVPFRVLGPLLFEAGILVRNSQGGLSFSEKGFQLLCDLYERTPSYRLRFERKKPSSRALSRIRRFRFESNDLTRTSSGPSPFANRRFAVGC